MQVQNVNHIPQNESQQKKAPIPTKNKIRRAILVSLLFLTVLFLILSLATRVRVREDRAYTTANEVALYLFTYKKLPSNYILKSSVSKSEQGKQPATGLYFGGDVFRNEGHIVDDNYTTKTDLRECDISYPDDPSNRGLKRLVYSADCTEIFYTWTHYGDRGEPAFVRITRFTIQKTSNVLWIFFPVIVLIESVGAILVVRKDRSFLFDLKASVMIFLKTAGFIVFSLALFVFCAVCFIVKEINKDTSLKTE